MEYELYTKGGELLGSTADIDELAMNISACIDGCDAIARWIMDTFDMGDLVSDLVNENFVDMTAKDFAENFIVDMRDAEHEDGDIWYGLTVRVKEVE